jgi:hypothetical protein
LGRRRQTKEEGKDGKFCYYITGATGLKREIR